MISVCIATHNGEKYIKEQLDSILCQLSSDDELVVSDDGSTDSTLEIVRSYNDSRIKIYKMQHTLKGMSTHYYVTKNFENALKHAKGEFIFLSDHDDVWMPNKVQTCCQLLKDHDIVVHNLSYMDTDGYDLNKSRYVGEFEKQNILMLRAIHYGCSMAFRAEWLNFVLPFPNKLPLHDYWISYIIEKLGKPVFLMDPLIKYRYRNDSVSHASNNGLMYKIKYRLYIMINIIARIVKIKLTR